MIALELETLLEDLGADNCLIVSTVESGLAILDSRDIAFAVVDVNLGDETSEEVAMALNARQLPFVFATGYGEVLPIMASFPTVPVLMKPFQAAQLSAALAEAGIF